MVRADFLERVRRYSFLLTMGFAVYLGYAVYKGQIVLQLGAWRGVNNSAWLGSEMGLTASVFLTLIGFYVVKNPIQRDRETRVGRILASTPMSKSFYTLAKALSNFAVLAAMVGVLALMAVVIQWTQGAGHPDYFALLSPVLIFGLSGVALTAALAVLFETLPVLRGGVGNVLYFFLWTALLALGTSPNVASVDSDTIANGRPAPIGHYLADYAGIASTMGQMQAQVHRLDPHYHGDASLTVGSFTHTQKTFLWNGVQWKSAIVLSRALWTGITAALVLAAALFFDRFDPARSYSPGLFKASLKKPGRTESSSLAAAADSQVGLQASRLASVGVAPSWSVAALKPFAATSKTGTKPRGRFSALVYAEFLLMVRGRGWWWYAVSAGLIVACIASPLAASRSGIILAAWLWPALLWSQMGTREAQFSTGPLIFSARNAFPRQLLASWAAGVLVAAITGGGLALRLILARDFSGLEAWTAAIVFIPSLALVLGVCTESRKPFEALYAAWWYIGPLHHIPKIDFMGTTAQSSTPGIFAFSAAALLAAALAWRKLRLAHFQF